MGRSQHWTRRHCEFAGAPCRKAIARTSAPPGRPAAACRLLDRLEWLQQFHDLDVYISLQFLWGRSAAVPLLAVVVSMRSSTSNARQQAEVRPALQCRADTNVEIGRGANGILTASCILLIASMQARCSHGRQFLVCRGSTRNRWQACAAQNRVNHKSTVCLKA